MKWTQQPPMLHPSVQEFLKPLNKKEAAFTRFHINQINKCPSNPHKRVRATPLSANIRPSTPSCDGPQQIIEHQTWQLPKQFSLSMSCHLSHFKHFSLFSFCVLCFSSFIAFALFCVDFSLTLPQIDQTRNGHKKSFTYWHWHSNRSVLSNISTGIIHTYICTIVCKKGREETRRETDIVSQFDFARQEPTSEAWALPLHCIQHICFATSMHLRLLFSHQMGHSKGQTHCEVQIFHFTTACSYNPHALMCTPSSSRTKNYYGGQLNQA